MVNIRFCSIPTACFMLLLTTQAFALNSRQVMWGGFFAGANISAMQSDIHVRTLVAPEGTYFNYTQDAPQLRMAGNNRMSSRNFSGGLFGGYEHQFGNILSGVEVSTNSLFINNSHSASAAFISDPSVRYILRQSLKADWQGSLRLKLGIVKQRWLGYLNGGATMTDIKYKSLYNDNNAMPGSGLPGALGKDTASKIQFGWTVGGGVEYALNNIWSVKIEYLYSDFGNVQTNYPIIPTPTLSEFSNSMRAKANLTVQNLLLGLTYRF